MSTAGAIRTTCPYCGVGCGVLASAREDGSVAIEGDPDHPANSGRLCSKGSALGETLSLDDRLLTPLVNGERASWNDALDLVADRFETAIREHGPDSVAFYVSGQLLTEDYYVANKLMKGFIGSANIDTNSRLCMASSVAGHKRAFGSDTVPGCYEDLELADLVVIVGSNLAWCHPVLYQRLAAARGARGTKVVVIDPRATATCEIADMHLAIRPGADVALFNGLLAHLSAAGRLDRQYIARHTTGLDGALTAASATSLADIAATTGLAPSRIADFYELFAATERTVTVFSQGVNQSSAGTDKVNAIINCHLATGRIGRPGMGPFSVTGQPNAMGGRETGGLANMLAAHMEIDNPAHLRIVQEFWRSPTIAAKPGLKAVDLFRAVGDGRIKAIWIMATNPVVSLPEADRVRDALARCPFVVASDVARHTDTTALAHVLLPSTAWGEKDGTVTNSERRISRQRSFLPAPGEARPDWWQVAEVARRMGFGRGFTYDGPAAIFAEHAGLTAAGNDGTRDLDLGAHAAISPSDYDALAPFQWPQRVGMPASTTRFFAAGNFFTHDRKARFVATRYRGPASATSEDYPLVLNTGRIRDQWHTMTRTAKSPRLMTHAPEPFAEVHPLDAEAHDLAEGTICEIRSEHGRGLFRVRLSREQQRGTIFVPMHWTDRLASRARIDALIARNTDPVSGQPELKYTPVAARRFPAAWHGFALSLQPPRRDCADYTAIAPMKCGYRTELAGSRPAGDWAAFAFEIIGASETGGEIIAYHDRAAGRHRFAAFAGERLVGVLFIAPLPLVIARSWLGLLLGTCLPPSARLQVLAGHPGADQTDKGPIVCACFEVGRNEITDAIAGGCTDADEIGALLKAGTNCGTCRSEIARLIAAAPPGKIELHFAS